jgi:hypothetical protein
VQGARCNQEMAGAFWFRTWVARWRAIEVWAGTLVFLVPDFAISIKLEGSPLRNSRRRC